MKRNQPGTGAPRETMGPFTRSLLFFFAGTCFFFVNSYVADRSASMLLSVCGSILFAVGFVLASRGTARYWRDVAARLKDSNDEEDQ